ARVPSRARLPAVVRASRPHRHERLAPRTTPEQPHSDVPDLSPPAPMFRPWCEHRPRASPRGRHVGEARRVPPRQTEACRASIINGWPITEKEIIAFIFT